MTVKGLSKVQKKLSKLPVVAKDRIAKAMEEGAQEIVNLAQNLVPIDDMTLHDSIGWTWGNAPRGSLSLATVRTSRKATDGLQITVFAGNNEAFYARWVEFGTSPHNVARGGGTRSGQRALKRGGGLGHPGSSARPFFFVSYRALRKRVRSKISRGVTAAAKQVARGG